MQTIKNTFTKRDDRGFTLIELLVVIAIIAVLAALVLAALSSAQKGSRDSKRQSDLNQYRSALAQYQSDNNGSYPGPQTAPGPIASGSLPCSTTGWSNYMTSCLTGTTNNPYNYVTDNNNSNFGICVQLERNSANMFAVGPTQANQKPNATCTPQG